MTPPDYTIRCSCGRSTTIRWSGHRYIPDSPSWFASYPEGWTCSKPGHSQHVPPQKLQPPITKLQVII